MYLKRLWILFIQVLNQKKDIGECSYDESFSDSHKSRELLIEFGLKENLFKKRSHKLKKVRK